MYFIQLGKKSYKMKNRNALLILGICIAATAIGIALAEKHWATAIWATAYIVQSLQLLR